MINRGRVCTVFWFAHSVNLLGVKSLGNEVFFNFLNGEGGWNISDDYTEELLVRKLIGVVRDFGLFEVAGNGAVVWDGSGLNADTGLDIASFDEVNIVVGNVVTELGPLGLISEDYRRDLVRGGNV